MMMVVSVGQVLLSRQEVGMARAKVESKTLMRRDFVEGMVVDCLVV